MRQRQLAVASITPPPRNYVPVVLSGGGVFDSSVGRLVCSVDNATGKRSLVAGGGDGSTSALGDSACSAVPSVEWELATHPGLFATTMNGAYMGHTEGPTAISCPGTVREVARLFALRLSVCRVVFFELIPTALHCTLVVVIPIAWPHSTFFFCFTHVCTCTHLRYPFRHSTKTSSCQLHHLPWHYHFACTVTCLPAPAPGP